MEDPGEDLQKEAEAPRPSFSVARDELGAWPDRRGPETSKHF